MQQLNKKINTKIYQIVLKKLNYFVKMLVYLSFLEFLIKKGIKTHINFTME